MYGIITPSAPKQNANVRYALRRRAGASQSSGKNKCTSVKSLAIFFYYRSMTRTQNAMKAIYESNHELAAEAASFAREVLEPTRRASDREGCSLEAGRVRVSECLHAAYKSAYALGYGSTSFSAELGGAGLSHLERLTIKEEIAAANMGLFMYFVLTEGAARIIQIFGTEEQKRVYLEPLVRGEFGGTMCITESEAGSDVGLIQTSAIPLADGTYSIRGAKHFISGGDHNLAENILHLVLARIQGDAPGTRGLTLFAVPARQVNADGSSTENDITVCSLERKMGIHSSSTVMLAFGDQGRCVGTLLGKPREGMQTMFHLINESRLNVGAIALSIASAATEYAEAYACQRIQGCRLSDRKLPNPERVPIAMHGNISSRLMRMRALVFAIRALNRRVASLQEEAADNNDAADLVDILVPAVKGFSSERGLDVARKAIDVLGGAGYVEDHPVEQYYRDLRITSIYEGTTDIQALDMIIRKLARREKRELLLAFLNNLALECKGSKDVAPLVQAWEKYQGRTFSALDSVLRCADNPDGGLYVTRLFLNLSGLIAGILMLHDIVRAVHLTEDQRNEAMRTAHFFNTALLPEFDAYLSVIESQNVDPMEMQFARLASSSGQG